MHKNLAEKYIQLKTAVGGNREKTHFEDTFGMPKEEQAHITGPSRANTRILAELEFALHLTQKRGGQYDAPVEEALSYLLAQQKENGVLTDAACAQAEEMLAPLAAEAKSYKLILAAHAHIDMNWMWSYTETVAIVLATFRSILNIMKQYPAFHFSQSQAAAYHIVEEFDPALMEEIKQRIREGRWEVTASAWVECDKNMPSTESMLRHILYTRKYLSENWGVRDFEIDFSPDTFGHSANMPEIDAFGDVKYFYHCRGLKEDYVLYRYRAPSGREVLAYREPYWYNGAITPQMGAGLLELSEKCAGLKTGLVVYGVGDHGGGPTRRDVERALEMQTWSIYPTIEFGTIRAFFHEAEQVREQLPVVSHEANYFAPGCYTTQSRIKRGNRRTESGLIDAETISCEAAVLAGFQPKPDALQKAWQNVLFTHFHDILTGSCVQDTREHAMGLYQSAMATANTQTQNAMRTIAEQIDTSSIPMDADACVSQAEGAGAGYGVENFIGVPSTERGSGRTRIFHVFNTLPQARTEAVELTVWDYTGDLRRLQAKDGAGKTLLCQLLDTELQQYWDHKYFRILVLCAVPADGYTTVVLSQKQAENYPVYFQQNERVSAFYEDYVLQNEAVCATISAKTGRLVSLRDRATGEELLQAEEGAGLELLDTEAKTSSAWQIGRVIRALPVDSCIQVEKLADGALRQSLRASYRVASSTAEVTYFLDAQQRGIRMELHIDWHEVGKETIPVLRYRAPVAYAPAAYQYDIPGGAIRRAALANDVPGLQYGMAVNENGQSAILISDSKYGYRGEKDALALTLINSSTSPDPYPERGIHTISLFLGFADGGAQKAEDQAQCFTHHMFYQPSNAHKGTLPMEWSLLTFASDSAVLCSVAAEGEKTLLLRGYETEGKQTTVKIRFADAVKGAALISLNGQPTGAAVTVKGNEICYQIPPYSMSELKVEKK